MSGQKVGFILFDMVLDWCTSDLSWIYQEAYFLSLHFFLPATTSPNDVDVAAFASRIEELVASVKRRSQRLYKDSDRCKGRV